MSITTALRKLSKEDRDEVKSLASDFRDNDGMDQGQSIEMAMQTLLDEADTDRNKLIKSMGRRNGH